MSVLTQINWEASPEQKKLCLNKGRDNKVSTAHQPSDISINTTSTITPITPTMTTTATTTLLLLSGFVPSFSGRFFFVFCP